SGRRRRLWPVLVTVLSVAAVAVGVGGYFGYKWTQDQFFVGAWADEVVVFHGIQQEVGPVQFFRVAPRTGKAVSKLSPPDSAPFQSPGASSAPVSPRSCCFRPIWPWSGTASRLITWPRASPRSIH